MILALTHDGREDLMTAVLALLQSQQLQPLQWHRDADRVYLEMSGGDRHSCGTLASLLVKVPGIRWVEQVEALPAEQQSAQWLDAMQQQAVGLLGINREARIEWFNERACSLLGQTLKKGTTLAQLFADSSGWKDALELSGETAVPQPLHIAGRPFLLRVNTLKGAHPIAALLQVSTPSEFHRDARQADALRYPGEAQWVMQSPAAEKVKFKLATVARAEAPALIVGESGSGRTALAWRCHRMGPARGAAFMPLDCRHNDLLAQAKALFGDDALLQAEAGTVYVANLEHMPLALQSRFVDWLATRRGDGPRLLASLSSGVEQAVEQGLLLAELGYRLDAMRLELPPLRARLDELPALCAALLDELHRTGLIEHRANVGSDVLEVFKTHHWPGNLSELKTVLYLAQQNTSAETLGAADLHPNALQAQEGGLMGLRLPEAMAAFERQFLSHWYRKYPSTRKLAARLGVSHTTIAQKLNKHRLAGDE